MKFDVRKAETTTHTINLRLNDMQWSELQKNADMHRFTKMMVELRKSHEIGRSKPFDISWHGVEPFKPDFSDGARFIAWQNCA